jgi:phytoene dehydrogenase-like protein
MYDTLIIGSDLSTLITALASNHRGMKTVLVAERDPDHVYAEAGYTFSVNPLPLASITGSAITKNFYPDLALFPDGLLSAEVPLSCLQIISPGYRLDLFSDTNTWLQEVKREFPESERAITNLFNSLERAGRHTIDWLASYGNQPSQGYTRKTLHKLINLPFLLRDYLSLRHQLGTLDRTFKAVLEAELSVCASLDFADQPPPLSALHALFFSRLGGYSPLVSRNAWASELYRRFVEEGGVLIKDCEVIRLEIISGRPVSLRSRSLVVSTQWEKLDQFLLDRKCLRRLKHRIKSIACTGHPFSLHMGVREAGLPERLAPYAVLVKEPKSSTYANNYLFLETSQPGERERAPTGRRAVTATVFLPVSPLIMGDDELRNVSREIFSTLEYVLPFLRESLDFLHVERSIRFSRDIQDTVQRKYTLGKRTILGMMAVAPKTRLPHVFLTGGLLRPGLGFEGEILSGIEAASLAHDALQKG